MELKKSMVLSLLACTAVFSATIFSPGIVQAEEAAASGETTAAAPADAAAIVQQEAQKNGYTYTSERYGYSIVCPSQPLGVVPASAIYDNKKGEVLIFANDGYNIQRAWLVIADAFTDNDIPPLDALTEQQEQELIKRLMDHNGYEFVRIADMSQTKGVYAVTAKEIEVDTNGDGVPDTTAQADTQMIVTFLRGVYGGHFSIQLIDNPELSKEAVADFNAGLLTFKEWPTTRVDGVVSQKNNAAGHKKK